MLKKYNIYILTRPKLGGVGEKGASPKSQSIIFFKPSLIETGAKIVQRRKALLKYTFLLSLRTHESMESYLAPMGYTGSDHTGNQLGIKKSYQLLWYAS